MSRYGGEGIPFGFENVRKGERKVCWKEEEEEEEDEDEEERGGGGEEA